MAVTAGGAGGAAGGGVIKDAAGAEGEAVTAAVVIGAGTNSAARGLSVELATASAPKDTHSVDMSSQRSEALKIINI